jgi:hypothetical protein
MRLEVRNNCLYVNSKRLEIPTLEVSTSELLKSVFGSETIFDLLYEAHRERRHVTIAVIGNLPAQVFNIEGLRLFSDPATHPSLTPEHLVNNARALWAIVDEAGYQPGLGTSSLHGITLEVRGVKM